VRILLTIPQMGVGGAERIVLELLSGLRTRGDAVALAAAPGPLDDEPALDAVPRIRLRERGRSLIGVAATTVRLRQATLRFEPDVVHAHGVRTAAASAAALRLHKGERRVPMVVTFHGVVPSEYRSSARILSVADHVVAVSGDVADALVAAGLPRARLSIIPNAISVRPTSPIGGHQAVDAELGSGAGAVITAVGRLVPQKAHHRLLEAARLVIDARSGTRFVLVGDGPLRAPLEAQTRSLGLDPAVRFLGMRRDARAIMGRSDIVVFSSEWEGMSIAALEAMGSGVPVVSTPTPGMTALLASGAGRIVSDLRPESLALAIIELLDRPALCALMGAVGRELVAERFSVEAMVERYTEVYAELAGRKSAS
jgi:glycosyltransferase involved in cell wall biosynthesis